MRRKTAQIILLAFIVLLALAIAVFGDRLSFGKDRPATDVRRPSNITLKVVFFDVGQGDSILLRDPDGNDVLIDGGPTDAVARKLAEHLPFLDRTIELVVLTHPHADHANGLAEVAKRFRIAQVLESGVLHDAAGYRTFENEIAAQGIQRQIIATSTTLTVGRIEITTLWPTESWQGREPPNDNLATGGGVNDTSIVLRAVYGSSTFLFTGDVSSAVEEILLGHGEDLDSDVLKVGHHGSKYSSSRAFLRAVSPAIAVIQAGEKNRYGHPTLQTLLRLKETDARIFRTDDDGDIVVETDGQEFSVVTQK